ncbi:dienelactone hydrolase family protein [Lichenibacterium minor]|uniref:Dienelactone hydrolase family protein n=1 Tax=Lichenibacterium minor TaxID=2316528 RepID=A0A4Q2U8K2_9HYPH|nr:dienelactone hydrolase family protein [Lichenibacterium minor]RYC31471.1 dienelactone hydrolase family protein [Lichenibacterium minor]
MFHNSQPQHPDQLPRPGEALSTDRRTFLVASLGVGFALAADPVMAQVITTPADGLVAGEIKIPTADGQIPAYRAMPEGAGPFPVMVVIEEIFGVHEYIKDVCRRYAKLGYLAVAPELFARQGDPLHADVKTIITDIVPKVPDAQAMSDLDATVAFATAKENKGDPTRVGATGFCWGGRMIWLYARHDPKLKAAVAFYGILGGKASPPTAIKPQNPLDFGHDVTVPVLGLYGGHDDNIPPELIAQMQAELKGTASEVVVYPDAPHGFFADYRPSYRPDAAKDAWGKAQAWFKDHGMVG